MSDPKLKRRLHLVIVAALGVSVVLCAVLCGWLAYRMRGMIRQKEVLRQADLYGDPLPEHAIARLGTVRLLPLGDVWAVALSPDGKTLATGTCPARLEQAAELWDVETGEKIATLVRPSHNLMSLAWSPDGRHLAIAHTHCVEIYDVTSHKPVRTLEKAAERGIWSLHWSPDGKQIAGFAAEGRQVCLWDARSGKLRNRRKYSEELHGVDFSPDSLSLAVCGEGILEVLDCRSFEPRMTAKDVPTVCSVAFSPDGKTLAGGTESGKEESCVVLWDVETGRETARWPPFEGTYAQVAYAADGKTIVSGSWRRALRLWDVETGEQRAKLEGPGCVGRYFSLSADGKTLASAEERASLWDVATGQRRFESDAHDSGVSSAVFSADGEKVISGSADGTIRWWELPGGRQIRKLSPGRGVLSCLALAPDGKMLATGNEDATVSLRNAETGQSVATLAGHEDIANVWQGVLAIDFSPDGKELVSGGTDGTVRFWDLADFRPVRQYRLQPGENANVANVQFAPDGKTLGWACSRGPVQISEVADGKEVCTIEDSVSMFYGPFAMSPKGHRIVTPGIDKEANAASIAAGELEGQVTLLRLWDYASGEEVWSTECIDSPNCMAFSPDGELIASATFGQRRSIQVWSAATGKKLLELHGHNDEIRSLAFSPDGSLLASCSQDTTVLIWDLAPARDRLD